MDAFLIIDAVSEKKVSSNFDRPLQLGTQLRNSLFREGLLLTSREHDKFPVGEVIEFKLLGGDVCKATRLYDGKHNPLVLLHFPE